MSATNPTTIRRKMRYFRNHYLCDDCPNEWADEMAVIAPSHCPCCDRKSEPYASEPLLENIRLAPEEAIPVLIGMLRDAGLIDDSDEAELTDIEVE